MTKSYRESKLSIFSSRQSTVISYSNLGDLFSNSTSTYGSESYDLPLILYPIEDENHVLSVIENEAYCFDVELFSAKMVDATFVEAVKKITSATPTLGVCDIICPLVELMLNKAMGNETYNMSPDLSQSITILSLNQKLLNTSTWPKISEFNIKFGQEQIELYVDTWKRSSDWLFCVEFLGFESEDCSNVFVYEVEWSKPTKSYPIPQATASVYFALEVYKMVPYDRDRTVEVSYIFECSNLIHKPGKIDFQERWLQNILDEKIKLFKKLPYSVPAGICGPSRSILDEEILPNTVLNFTCSKKTKHKN